MRYLQILVALFSTVVFAQPATPPPVYSAAAAYDSGHSTLLTFGGFTGRGYSGATWQWQDKSWKSVSVAGPAPRNGAAMTFDAARQRYVLFGGDTRERMFGDTWEFDGTSWTQVSTDGPTGRIGHQLVYDSKRRLVVMFGGMTTVGGIKTLADTWEWDGRVWRRRSTDGPAARALFAMTYDPSIDRVVLFGGTTLTTTPPPPDDTQSDTWEWDGTRWVVTPGGGPTPRDHVTMAFDPMAKRVVLVGGSGRDGSLSDVWQRVGRRWSRVDAQDTPAVAGHHVFVSAAGVPLVFGGFGARGPTAEIWQMTGTVWKRERQ